MQIAKPKGKNGCEFVGIWTHNHFLRWENLNLVDFFS
jgi:hypothetical protein